MPSRGRLLLFAVAVLGATAGLVAYLALPMGGARDTAAERLLRLSLPDPQGRETSFRQWEGRVLLVNLWATWCAPCREEIPALIAVQNKYVTNGVQIVGIAVDSADKVKEFATEFRINYPLVIGGLEAIEISRMLGNRAGGLPFTAVLDRQGKLALAHTGGMTLAEIDSAIRPLIR